MGRWEPLPLRILARSARGFCFQQLRGGYRGRGGTDDETGAEGALSGAIGILKLGTQGKQSCLSFNSGPPQQVAQMRKLDYTYSKNRLQISRD